MKACIVHKENKAIMLIEKYQLKIKIKVLRDKDLQSSFQKLKIILNLLKKML